MKIEHCEYSHDCGDGYWFCGHRSFCPYDKCELPKQEPRKQTVEDLKEKINRQKQPIKKTVCKHKTKYDWDTAIPIMQEMRDAGNSWPAISKATGIPKQSLMNRWKWEGMTIRTGAGD